MIVAKVENLKMVALAAMILLATAICDLDSDRISDVDPVMMPAVEIETRVLIG